MFRNWRWWNSKQKNDSHESNQAVYEKEIEHLRKKAPIPALWLFGKTGSGKSSIVRYLTGAEAATIGEGYRPETKFSQRFDFPDSTEPLLTFIDTRGLGEAAYDPQPDIDRFTSSTHLMIVVVRVKDHALDGILEPLRRIRKASPSRPVLLVLTCLHDVPGAMDISKGPDPFVENKDVPQALQTLIAEKARQFEGLFESIVPIDLTQPEDEFDDPEFGGERLKQAILDHLPHAYRHGLLILGQTDHNLTDRQKRAQWQVLASSLMAASAGAVPIPWVDIPVVLGLQTHMAYRIASIYEQEVAATDWAVISSVAGTRIAARLGITEALKFIPFLGLAAGAASSFAFTYALGKSYDWYFSNVRGGKVPSADRMKEIFRDELKRGQELWRAQ